MMRLPRWASLLVALSVLTSVTTADAGGGWALWKHSYEVWVDSNKENHRRNVVWKKLAATAAKLDCNDRAVSEARAEYYTLTGQGVGATLTGSEVGFNQKNTRYKRAYRSFECWPDTVDPRTGKGR